MAMAPKTGMKRERWRRLHQSFLDAAERFPTLGHAALTAGVPNDWFIITEPLVRPFGDFPYSRRIPSEMTLSLLRISQLDDCLWDRVLSDHRAQHEPYPFKSVHQLSVDGRLWIGRFVDREWTLIDLSERVKAVQLFERLSGEAMLSIGHPPVTIPPNCEGEVCADWWLSCVYEALAIKPRSFRFDPSTLPIRFGSGDSTPIPVLRLPCNVFLASATALEALARRAAKEASEPSRSFTPKILRRKLDISDSTLVRYAKLAKIARPSVGKREFHYSVQDVRKLCNCISSSTAGPKLKDASTQLLQDIRVAMKE